MMKGLLSKLRIRENSKLFIYALGASMGIGYLFYNTIWGFLISPLLFLVFRKASLGRKKEEYRIQLTEEFCEVLKILQASLIGGYSLERAFIEAEKETLEMNGANSSMYQELVVMNKQISMNETVEAVFAEFANRSGLEEIELFSEVLSFAKRSGGNIVDILEGTILRIQQIRETEREIEVMVASRDYEQKVMIILPMIILLYLKISFGEYLSVLYGNVLGISFMSLCILIYVAAILWGRRLLHVTV